MGRAVGANETGAVERKTHGQVLQGDVVDDLIVAALQKGRVDRAEGLVTLRRKSRRKGYGVLLGDARIEGPVGEFLAEHVEAGAGRHGGRDRNDLVVPPCFLDEALGEDLRVGRSVGLGLGLSARDDVEGTTPWYLSAAASAGA